jgi:hypothetical protein
MLITKEARITPLPMTPIKDLDRLFLPRPLIKKPSKGNKGINQAICRTFCIREREEAP